MLPHFDRCVANLVEVGEIDLSAIRPPRFSANARLPKLAQLGTISGSCID